MDKNLSPIVILLENGLRLALRMRSVKSRWTGFALLLISFPSRFNPPPVVGNGSADNRELVLLLVLSITRCGVGEYMVVELL